MQFLNELLALAVLGFSTVSAVTPILAQNGCAAQPSWQASASTTDVLFLRAWSIDGNESFELQNHGGQTKKYSENLVEWVIHTKVGYAQNTIRCINTGPDLSLIGLGNPWNPCGQVDWNNGVKLSGPKFDDNQPDANRLVLGNGVAGYPLRFYWHDTQGGKLYLGREGNTTWGVTRDETRIFPEAWRLRFVGSDGVLGDKEVPIFLSAESL